MFLFMAAFPCVCVTVHINVSVLRAPLSDILRTLSMSQTRTNTVKTI